MTKYDYYFVGTNPNTLDKNNPIPYNIKKDIMTQLCPEIQGHIMAEQNLFTMVTNIYTMLGSNVEMHVCTDESWLVPALQKYNGVEGLHGFYMFDQIMQDQTVRLSSSSQLRQSIKNNQRETFYQLAGLPSNTVIKINNKDIDFFDVINEYLN